MKIKYLILFSFFYTSDVFTCQYFSMTHMCRGFSSNGLIRSPQKQKGLLYDQALNNCCLCSPSKSMSQRRSSAFLYLHPQNTNWIVKAEQLLFGNAVINSGLHPVEYHSLSKKQCNWLNHTAVCAVEVKEPGSFPLRALYKCVSLILLLSACASTAFIVRGWLGDVLVNGATVQKRLSVTVVDHHHLRFWKHESSGPLSVCVPPHVCARERACGWIIRCLWAFSFTCQRIESEFPVESLIQSLKSELVQWPT